MCYSGKYRTVTRRLLALLLLLAVAAAEQQATMYLPDYSTNFTMMKNGQPMSNFTNDDEVMDCSRPSLYIYPQNTSQLSDNSAYYLQLTGFPGSFEITTQAEYSSFVVSVEPNQCLFGNCLVALQNNCPTDTDYQFNTFTLKLGNFTTLSWVVNCNAQVYFKPFEWGLFVLILLASLVITLATFYSRAWSYGGYGLEINYVFVLVFNILFIIGAILVCLDVNFLEYIISAVGSILGFVGVTVCANQLLFIMKVKALNARRIFNTIRGIDIISFLFGVLIVALYWIFYQNWIITDIISICTIVASIKLLKLTSLLMAVVFLGSVLVVEIVVSLIIHFSLQVSYNNLIINRYDSPIMVEMPSITPQLFRKCAWLPATSLILPGLLLSYLRRFDVSRSTHLYLVIGYLSFYIGSVLWMVADLSTIHSLPFAIISDPVTILLVVIFAYRRNQIRTLWNGYFYDPELNFLEQRLVVDRSESDHITELVQDLKVREQI